MSDIELEGHSHCKSATKKKRRKRGLLFCARKQLLRSRMGRRKAIVVDDDVGEIAEILSLAKGSTDGKDSSPAQEEQPGIHSMEMEETQDDSENQPADIDDVMDLTEQSLVS